MTVMTMIDLDWWGWLRKKYDKDLRSRWFLGYDYSNEDNDDGDDDDNDDDDDDNKDDNADLGDTIMP